MYQVEYEKYRKKNQNEKGVGSQLLSVKFLFLLG